MWRIISFILLWGVACGSRPIDESPFLELQLFGCVDWHAAVYRSGCAHHWVTDMCGGVGSYSRLQRLTAAEVKQIIRAIDEHQFSDFPSEIGPTSYVTDEESFRITVFTDGVRREVTAFGLSRAKDPGQASKFLSLWEKIMEVVPEPEIEIKEMSPDEAKR